MCIRDRDCASACLEERASGSVTSVVHACMGLVKHAQYMSCVRESTCALWADVMPPSAVLAMSITPARSPHFTAS
eukprot:8084030-Alexandrium_andersonii.AAC.1